MIKTEEMVVFGEIKGMIMRAKSPKMDNSHQLDLNRLDKLVNKLYYSMGEESNDKVENKNVLCIDPDKEYWFFSK